jgi:hypothetical protein
MRTERAGGLVNVGWMLRLRLDICWPVWFTLAIRVR